jgi:dihydroorotate dehydrogenase
MGFNNEGVDALAERLKKRKKSSLIIGGNIGKNKMTPNENAKADYLKCMDALFPYVDYFVVNVSSPNTPGMLLTTLMTENNKRAKPKPLLLKIAPDLTNSQLDDIIEITGITGIHGIIATNTTLDRSMLSVDHSAIGPGGLSGAPLTRPSTEVIRYLVHKSGGNIPVIGVGGIMSPQDALEKLAAGASLVQVYTGLVYEGPGLVRRINDEISRQKTATGRN